METNGNATKGFAFNKFFTPRIIGGIAIAIIVLWALFILFRCGTAPSHLHDTASHHEATTEAVAHGDDQATTHSAGGHDAEKDGHHTGNEVVREDGSADSADSAGHTVPNGHAAQDTHAGDKTRQATGHDATAAEASDHAAVSGYVAAFTEDTHGRVNGEDGAHPQLTAGHSTSTGHPLPLSVTAARKPIPKGVAFVEAAMKPMDYELEERWWGWRPNDIIDVTDNINHFQLGVLEVTRRTTVALGERISRYGTTDAFDENLENAMNWFMVKATSYWFPSAESKYRDGLEEMEAYLEKLKAGEATFYTRTDNLIPLLASFEDLLGSCDENLVKDVNEDGSPVSFFAVDNYFYYTQGVASSMATVLEAVYNDFLLTLESRHGTELLHHAIISCQKASELDPWIILDSKLSSVFANHRANMAAPISHARFFLGQLIKTLST